MRETVKVVLVYRSGAAWVTQATPRDKEQKYYPAESLKRCVVEKADGSGDAVIIKCEKPLNLIFDIAKDGEGYRARVEQDGRRTENLTVTELRNGVFTLRLPDYVRE